MALSLEDEGWITCLASSVAAIIHRFTHGAVQAFLPLDHRTRFVNRNGSVMLFKLPLTYGANKVNVWVKHD